MTVRLKLNNLVQFGPVCYKNFYKHNVDNISIGINHVDTINSLLQREPCSVKLILIKKPTNKTVSVWALEFDSKEDYTTFVLRWS